MKLYPKLETGLSNTRLDSHKQVDNSKHTLQIYRSIDYLTLTYRFLSVEQAKEKLDFLANYLDDVVVWHCEKPRDLGKWFDKTYKTVRRATVGWSERKDSTVEAIAVLPGQVLQATTPENLRRALLHLHQWYQNCSRFDLAYDNNSGLLSGLRENAHAAWKQGLHAGFKKLKVINDGNSPTDIDTTHYWGSRESASLVRIYDKGDSTRFEVENKRKKSTALYARYIELGQMGVSIEDTLIHLFNASLEGIEFYSEKKSKNLDRNVIADFWQEFRDVINYEEVVLPKVSDERSFEKSLAWLERSVAATLAMVKQGLGELYPQFHSGLIEKGQVKIDSYKKLIAQRVRREESEKEENIKRREDNIKEWKRREEKRMNGDYGMEEKRMEEKRMGGAEENGIEEKRRDESFADWWVMENKRIDECIRLGLDF
jgi:hypothetical protein